MNRSPRRHRGLVALALIGCVVARGEPAAGGPHTDFSQEELHSLPRVCLAQEFINQELESPVVPEAERLQTAKKLGPSFTHYHHYCWALLHVGRAAKPGEQEHEYKRAIDNLNYVILRVARSFVFLPEVYFLKGSAYEGLKDQNAAMVEYQNAVRTKAGSTPACAALVRNYLELGDLKRARAVLAEGLKRDPGSKTLAEQKSALDELEKKR